MHIRRREPAALHCGKRHHQRQTAAAAAAAAVSAAVSSKLPVAKFINTLARSIFNIISRRFTLLWIFSPSSAKSHFFRAV